MNAVLPSWAVTEKRRNSAVSGAGPATVAESPADSGRVPMQMAPASPQSVVAGSSTVTSASPAGSTVISQRWFLPDSSRRTSVTAPFATVKAWSRSVTWLRPDVQSSLNRSSKVNAVLPSCEAGIELNDAVSAGPGPGTVAVTPADSGRFPTQMAPASWQSVVAWRLIETSASLSGSTVISHSRLGSSPSGSSRRARVTSPSVTVKAWSRSVR